MDLSGDKNAPIVSDIMLNSRVPEMRSLNGADYNREFERIHRIVGKFRLQLSRKGYATAKCAIGIIEGEYDDKIAALEAEVERLRESSELDAEIILKLAASFEDAEARLAAVKELYDDEYVEAIAALCGPCHPAAKACREIATILDGAALAKQEGDSHE